MTTLDKVIAMQKEGLPESEITSRLREEGISPKEINDAINQAKIKSAINNGDQEYENDNQEPLEPPLPPEAQEQYQEQQYPQEQYSEAYYPQTPQAYSGEEYYPPSNNLDTETISEIAEQVVMEKTEELSKKVEDVESFKDEIQDKVDGIDERLKKIEKTIDKLQQAIIGKIGEFGESTVAIHKDLDNLHNTVSKLMNPLIDNYRELKKLNKKSSKKH